MLGNKHFVQDILLFLVSMSTGHPDLPGVLKALNWSKFNLIGHQGLWVNPLLKSSFVKISSQNSVPKSACSFESLPLVFITDSGSDLQSLKNCLVRRNSETVLVVLQNATISQTDFEKSMMSFKHSKSMFVFHDHLKSLHILYTNSHTNQVVWNDVEIIQKPLPNIKIQRNLKGTIVKDLTLSWIPWLKIGHCQLEGIHDCNVSGFLADFLDYAASTYNLTIIHDKVQNLIQSAHHLLAYVSNAPFAGTRQ